MRAPPERMVERPSLRQRLREKVQTRRTSLKTRLIVALLLIAWLPALTVLPLQGSLIDRNASEHIQKQLLQLSAVQQRRINRELDRLIDGLALVGSRTQMRMSLDAFNRNGRREDQALVNTILRDAAGSTDSVSGIWIHGLDGGLVAGTSPVGEAAEIFDLFPNHSQASLFPYWRSGASDARVWLGTPLQLQERIIGQLSMEVEITDLMELLNDFPDRSLIGESVIVLYRPDGERCVLSGASAECEDAVRFVNLVEETPSDGLVMRDGIERLWLTLPLKHDFGALLIHSVPDLQRTLRGSVLAGYGFILVGVVGLTSLFSLWISSRLAKPLGELAHAVSVIELGNELPSLNSARWPRELEVLSQVMISAVNSQRKTLSALRQEIRIRRDTQSQLVDLANSDELTGLSNRRHFLQRLSAQVAMAESEHAALLYMDLDRFKPINDQYGHEAGDTVLKVIAERLRNVIRDQDIAARLGGGEFGILLRDDDEQQVEASSIAHRIEDAINQPIGWCGETVTVGCSIGIAPIKAGTDVQTVLNQADLAMYKIKQGRKRARQGA